MMKAVYVAYCNKKAYSLHVFVLYCIKSAD